MLQPQGADFDFTTKTNFAAIHPQLTFHQDLLHQIILLFVLWWYGSRTLQKTPITYTVSGATDAVKTLTMLPTRVKACGQRPSSHIDSQTASIRHPALVDSPSHFNGKSDKSEHRWFILPPNCGLQDLLLVILCAIGFTVTNKTSTKTKLVSTVLL